MGLLLLPVNSARVAVMAIYVEEDATFVDALTTALVGKCGGPHLEIVSQSEATLADGTPATEAVLTWMIPQGYPADSFALGVRKDDKWVLVTITTVARPVPYDEALFPEIAHSLQLE